MEISEKRKLWVKIFLVLLFALAWVSVGFAFFNSLSCVSEPKRLKDLPPICQKAQDSKFLGVQSKTPQVFEDISQDSYLCRAIIRKKECQSDFEAFIKKNNALPDNMKLSTERALDRASLIYAECMKDMKGG